MFDKEKLKGFTDPDQNLKPVPGQEEKLEKFPQPYVAPDMGYEGGAGEFYDEDAILNSRKYRIEYSFKPKSMLLASDKNLDFQYFRPYPDKLVPHPKNHSLDPNFMESPNFYISKREEVDGEPKFSVGGIAQWSDQEGADFLGREKVRTGGNYLWKQVRAQHQR